MTNFMFPLSLFVGNFISHFILGKSLFGCFIISTLAVVIFLILDRIAQAAGVYKK